MTPVERVGRSLAQAKRARLGFTEAWAIATAWLPPPQSGFSNAKTHDMRQWSYAIHWAWGAWRDAYEDRPSRLAPLVHLDIALIHEEAERPPDRLLA